MESLCPLSFEQRRGLGRGAWQVRGDTPLDAPSSRAECLFSRSGDVPGWIVAPAVQQLGPPSPGTGSVGGTARGAMMGLTLAGIAARGAGRLLGRLTQ
jgi:hypothetical protein